jgi:hypothetical protein
VRFQAETELFVYLEKHKVQFGFNDFRNIALA